MPSNKRRTNRHRSRRNKSIRRGGAVAFAADAATVESEKSDIHPEGGSTFSNTSTQMGGTKRKRGAKRKRGGSGFAAAISQALVPFGLLGAQQMYGRRRSSSRKTKKAFKW